MKKPTNLSLDEDLVNAGQEVFPGTRYHSLSGFVESMLRSELRKRAARMRKDGIKVPATVFTK
jgi:Arc/MetJ family transcription regulator